MTLYRQLLVVILLIYGALLAVVFSIEIDTTRDYLSAQQQSNVNNTATSLGLSLVPYLEDGDQVGAESVINAMFDSGYYRRIELHWFGEQAAILRSNPASVSGVPQWFIELDLFQATSNEQVLTSGWMQLAELKVEGHLGYAYLQLWAAMVDLAKLFVVGFLVTVLLMMQALRYILKPLEQIKEQALKVEQRHFGESIPLPRSPELRSVVSAINTMSDSIAVQFEVQVKEANQLREQAFKDNVTELGNRAFLVNQAKSWLAETASGGLILMSLEVLEAIHVKHGFAARDDFLKSLGKQLLQAQLSKPSLIFARISNQEIAVLAPDSDEQALKDLSYFMNQTVLKLLGVWKQYHEKPAVFGIALVQEESQLTDLLTAADRALQQARDDRESPIHLAELSDNSLTRVRWKEVLESTIRQQGLKYKAQKVVMIDGAKLFHHELFTTIEVDAQQYAAGQFMPAIEQLQLGARFDQLVVEQAFGLLQQNAKAKLAINLTLSALSEQEFLDWLQQQVKAQTGLGPRCAFEIPETAFLNQSEGLLKTVELLHQLGFQIGVDQYGRNLSSLSYLARVKPNYVKIDYGYTAQALTEDGDKHILNAICRAAKNLQVITIAQRVEDQQQVALLAELPIDAYQGYVHPPKPLAIPKGNE